MKSNLTLVAVLEQFGGAKGMTPAQVALAWLLAKESWIVPIPGTTNLAHLEENLKSATFDLTMTEVKELEDAVAKIEIVGNRYPTEEQKKISR